MSAQEAAELIAIHGNHVFGKRTILAGRDSLIGLSRSVERAVDALLDCAESARTNLDRASLWTARFVNASACRRLQSIGDDNTADWQDIADIHASLKDVADRLVRMLAQSLRLITTPEISGDDESKWPATLAFRLLREQNALADMQRRCAWITSSPQTSATLHQAMTAGICQPMAP